jgi:PIN domain nuclease of toxin-antitoxin system
MIILDTHIWIWWLEGSAQLPPDYRAYLTSESSNGFGICAISGWEVAKLVEHGKVSFALPIEQWFIQAVDPPMVLIPLTWEVAVEATRLPGSFHRDPADQMIVATARLFDCPLVTVDRKIRAYPHVRLVP